MAQAVQSCGLQIRGCCHNEPVHMGAHAIGTEPSRNIRCLKPTCCSWGRKDLGASMKLRRPQDERFGAYTPACTQTLRSMTQGMFLNLTAEYESNSCRRGLCEVSVDPSHLVTPVLLGLAYTYCTALHVIRSCNLTPLCSMFKPLEWHQAGHAYHRCVLKQCAAFPELYIH